MFVFAESGSEALREGYEPKRLILHNELNAGVEFIDEKGGRPRSTFAQATKVKGGNTINPTHVIYKTNPMAAQASHLQGATIDVARRVPEDLDPRQRLTRSSARSSRTAEWSVIP